MKSYATKLLGVDLCEQEGISEIRVTKLIAEIGTDSNQWKNEKRFTNNKQKVNETEEPCRHVFEVKDLN